MCVCIFVNPSNVIALSEGHTLSYHKLFFLVKKQVLTEQTDSNQTPGGIKRTKQS